MTSTAASCSSESSGAPKKSAGENTSETVSDKSNLSGKATLIVTGNVHGQLDPCG